jgi:hypothetical protein
MAVRAPVHEFAVYMEIVASVEFSTYANVGCVEGTQLAEGAFVGLVGICPQLVAITMTRATKTIGEKQRA